MRCVTGSASKSDKSDSDDKDKDDEMDEDTEYDYTEYIPASEYNCASFYDNTWATVVGWGATYKSDVSCELREALTRISPSSDEHCRSKDLADGDQLRDKICAFNPDWETDISCLVGSSIILKPLVGILV